MRSVGGSLSLSAQAEHPQKRTLSAQEIPEAGRERPNPLMNVSRARFDLVTG